VKSSPTWTCYAGSGSSPDFWAWTGSKCSQFWQRYVVDSGNADTHVPFLKNLGVYRIPAPTIKPFFQNPDPVFPFLKTRIRIFQYFTPITSLLQYFDFPIYHVETGSGGYPAPAGCNYPGSKNRLKCGLSSCNGVEMTLKRRWTSKLKCYRGRNPKPAPDGFEKSESGTALEESVRCFVIIYRAKVRKKLF
jgi:hypothetical protein